jgi:hypothetical protein
MRKDIVRVLHELTLRGKATESKHDNIILETTGLANPGPVAFTFFSHPWISKHFVLDSVVYAPCLGLVKKSIHAKMVCNVLLYWFSFWYSWCSNCRYWSSRIL